jgi:hypothetical protein
VDFSESRLRGVGSLVVPLDPPKISRKVDGALNFSNNVLPSGFFGHFEGAPSGYSAASTGFKTSSRASLKFPLGPPSVSSVSYGSVSSSDVAPSVPPPGPFFGAPAGSFAFSADVPAGSAPSRVAPVGPVTSITLPSRFPSVGNFSNYKLSIINDSDASSSRSGIASPSFMTHLASHGSGPSAGSLLVDGSSPKQFSPIGLVASSLPIPPPVARLPPTVVGGPSPKVPRCPVHHCSMVERIRKRSGLPFLACPSRGCRSISASVPSSVPSQVLGEPSKMGSGLWKDALLMGPASVAPPSSSAPVSSSGASSAVVARLPGEGADLFNLFHGVTGGASAGSRTSFNSGAPAISVFAAFGVKGRDFIGCSATGSVEPGPFSVPFVSSGPSSNLSAGTPAILVFAAFGVKERDFVGFSTTDPGPVSSPSHAERTTGGEESLTSVEAGSCSSVSVPSIVPSPSHAERTTDGEAPLTSVEAVPVVSAFLAIGVVDVFVDHLCTSPCLGGVGNVRVTPPADVAGPPALASPGPGYLYSSVFVSSLVSTVGEVVTLAPSVDIAVVDHLCTSPCLGGAENVCVVPPLVVAGPLAMASPEPNTRFVPIFSGNLAQMDLGFLALCADIALYHPVPLPVSPPSGILGPIGLSVCYSFPPPFGFLSIPFIRLLLFSTGSFLRRWIAYVCYFLRAPPSFLPSLCSSLPG